MPELSGLAIALWQDQISASAHDVHLLMWFAGIIAAALVAQAAGVSIAVYFAAKLLHRVEGLSQKIEGHVDPILVKANDLLQELTPKINSVSKNVEEISYTIRVKVDELAATVGELNQTVKDANLRTRMQVARVDGIVTEAMYATEDISRSVQQGIKGPVRQIAGIVAGVKAAVEKLVERSPFGK